jgi:Protein of unknown function (DUF2857)
MSTSNQAAPSSEHDARTLGAATIVLKCATSRMFALGRLIAVLEEFDQEQIEKIRAEGMTPTLLDRVRNLSLTDSWHITRRPCGLSVMLDTGQFTAELNRLEMIKQDQALVEHFVRNGATAAMLSRLFHETPSRVRQLRAQIGPSIEKGRPKMPDEDVRDLITASWAEVCRSIPATALNCDRRFKALHDLWPSYQLCALDAVVNSLEPDRGLSTHLVLQGENAR